MSLRLGATLALSLCWLVTAPADDKTPKKETRPVLTVLGTVKGEITQVSDGGHKIEVTYKELVASSTTRSGLGQGAGSARFRLPRTTLKEKNQELDLRVQSATIIRLLDREGDPAEGSTKEKKDDGEQTQQAEKDAASNQDQAKVEATSKKSDQEKGEKAVGKAKKERSLPGAAGKAGDLKKGQVAIVTVAREDLPGFSRLVATSIYVLGEK